MQAGMSHAAKDVNGATNGGTLPTVCQLCRRHQPRDGHKKNQILSKPPRFDDGTIGGMVERAQRQIKQERVGLMAERS
jgi:hypothetical protein